MTTTNPQGGQVSEPTCALWYMEYGRCAYVLCDDEADAASFACSMEDQEYGIALGIQFVEGRTIERDAWPALDAERDRRDAEYVKRQAEIKARPPIPKREVRDPFGGRQVEVEATAPAWLGKP